MGLAHSPRIVTNGLVGYWDAGNTQRSARGFKNLLNLASWTLGSDSASGNGGTTFSRNGTVAENRRILDTGPFGVSTVVWDTPSNDADSNDDGGWNTGSIPIDSSKMYRFSVWMRRKIIGNGSYYLGVYGINSSGTNEGVLNRSNGVINTNLYFSAGGWPTGNIPANSWMLVVGHVWPAGSGAGADHPDSGLWNTSGVKFSNYTSSGDAIWQATNTITWHRSYLYYSTDTTTNQQWYQPRIDLVDGSQPSIADLISGVGSEWYDIVGSSHGNITNSAQLYNSSGFMSFDGVDDYVDLGNSIQLSNNFTCSFWHRNLNTGYLLDQGNIGTDPTGCLEVGSYGLNVTYNNGSTVTADGFATFIPTNWNNVVFTFASGVVNFYINGNFDSTKTLTSVTSFLPQGQILKIGRRAFNTAAILSGQVGNVSIYNRVLSDQEVKQNYNALRGRFGL